MQKCIHMDERSDKNILYGIMFFNVSYHETMKRLVGWKIGGSTGCLQYQQV